MQYLLAFRVVQETLIITLLLAVTIFTCIAPMAGAATNDVIATSKLSVYSPETLDVGDTAHITCLLGNTGTDTWQSVEAYFQTTYYTLDKDSIIIDGNGCKYARSTGFRIGSIEPGETKTIEFDVTITKQTNSFTFGATGYNSNGEQRFSVVGVVYTPASA